MHQCMISPAKLLILILKYKKDVLLKSLTCYLNTGHLK